MTAAVCPSVCLYGGSVGDQRTVEGRQAWRGCVGCLTAPHVSTGVITTDSPWFDVSWSSAHPAADDAVNAQLDTTPHYEQSAVEQSHYHHHDGQDAHLTGESMTGFEGDSQKVVGLEKVGNIDLNQSDVVRSGNDDFSRVSPECHTLQAGGNSCKALAPPGALGSWSPAIMGGATERDSPYKASEVPSASHLAHNVTVNTCNTQVPCKASPSHLVLAGHALTLATLQGAAKGDYSTFESDAAANAKAVTPVGAELLRTYVFLTPRFPRAALRAAQQPQLVTQLAAEAELARLSADLELISFVAEVRGAAEEEGGGGGRRRTQ